MLKTVAVALALLIPVPALAIEPYVIHPTESEFVQYEARLEQFFNIPIFSKGEGAGKYLRTSNAERRRDGQVVCSMLTAHSTEEYLTRSFEKYQALYFDNPQKLDDEVVYTVGVTTAAIDTMCTEHRAELQDFFANKQKSAAGTSSRNR